MKTVDRSVSLLPKFSADAISIKGLRSSFEVFRFYFSLIACCVTAIVIRSLEKPIEALPLHNKMKDEYFFANFLSCVAYQNIHSKKKEENNVRCGVEYPK